MKIQSLASICATAVIGLAACGGGGSASNAPDAATADYQAALVRWERAGLAAYEFTLTTNCYCLPESPITVVVQDGRISGAYYADSFENVPESRLESLPTLQGLFSRLNEAYKARAATVDVRFDPDYGYIESLYVDLDRMIADEEVGYQVSNFQPSVVKPYKVTVTKYTGARQCEGGGETIEVMQSQLTAAGFPVLSASCGTDGMIRPAACGLPSGDIGLFTFAADTASPILPDGFMFRTELPEAQKHACP